MEKIKRYIQPQNINGGRLAIHMYGKHIEDNGTTYRMPMISYHLRNSYKTMLDVSCGDSAPALYYKWKGYDMTTTEYNDELVKNSIDLGFPCSKVDLNNKKLPFENNSFDVVVMTEIIEHIKYPKEILEEAFRVAKHVVIVTTPVGRSYFAGDHINFWYDVKELYNALLQNIETKHTRISTFVTVPQDYETVSRSFIIALYKTR